MKKIIYFISALLTATIVVSCGPSQAEKEAAEKARLDSIRMADSLANLQAEYNSMQEAAKAEQEKQALDEKLSNIDFAGKFSTMAPGSDGHGWLELNITKTGARSYQVSVDDEGQGGMGDYSLEGTVNDEGVLELVCDKVNSADSQYGDVSGVYKMAGKSFGTISFSGSKMMLNIKAETVNMAKGTFRLYNAR